MHLTVVSDLHLDARTGGMSRHNDIEAALFDAVDSANAKSNLFICLGDVCNPDSGSCVFQCIRTLIEVTKRLHVPSLWLAGNHDVIENGSGQTTLEPLKSLGDKVSVIDSPGWYAYSATKPIGIFALPFTPYSHKYDPKVQIQRDQHAPSSVQLVMGHLNVKGAQPGDEEDMVRGREVWLPVPEIQTKWPQAMIINGHIHQRQTTPDQVHIPGSLERLRFDEERHRPGWLELVL
jgi:DNA repair exonuclease SbcCD nuclease subunit